MGVRHFRRIGPALVLVCLLWYRDDPGDHFAVNEAELAIVRIGASAPKKTQPVPWARLFADPDMLRLVIGRARATWSRSWKWPLPAVAVEPAALTSRSGAQSKLALATPVRAFTSATPLDTAQMPGRPCATTESVGQVSAGLLVARVDQADTRLACSIQQGIQAVPTKGRNPADPTPAKILYELFRCGHRKNDFLVVIPPPIPLVGRISCCAPDVFRRGGSAARCSLR